MKVSDLVFGQNAFYNQKDYQAKTKTEFQTRSAPLPSHVVETGNKALRIAKQTLFLLGAALILYATFYRFGSLFSSFQKLKLPSVSEIPLAPKALLAAYTLPQAFHKCAGTLVIPGFWIGLEASNWRKNIDPEAFDESGHKIKRFSIQVDGYTIDAVLTMRNKGEDNGRWTLISGGNGELYEALSIPGYRDSYLRMLDALESNSIYFNYAGVGASSGLPDHDIILKAYEAMMTILEDDLKANEILLYGHSIGGGVQGEALKNHELKEGVCYLAIKSRTFLDFADTAADVLFKPLDSLIRLVNWNFNSKESSPNEKCPQIILQTTSGEWYQDLSKNPETIEFDGVISSVVSLAYNLLKEPITLKHTHFMGIPEAHNSSFLIDPRPLADKVNRMLKDFYGA